MSANGTYRLTLLLVAIVLIGGNLLIDRWPTTLHYGDSNGYYLHVTSALLYGDVGDYSESIGALKKVNPNADDPRTDKFGIRPTPIGRNYIKYTVGVPILEAPFFLLAHAYAKVSGEYAADGWSPPYMLSVGFAIACYVLLGLWLLMMVLKRYFPPQVVSLTILSLVIATNLFYQVTYVTMSHGFLFFLHCLLIYLSARFYDRPGWWRALGIGLTVGLISLTRVPEVVAVLVPLLWGISGWTGLRERINFFSQNLRLLIPATIGLLVAFSPQLAYWYYVSGELFFNPYKGEGFNFLQPHILNAFFDFKNGWLIYTPIMALSLFGLFFLRRFKGAPLFSILAFCFFHLWIHYSYYVWSYFPGLGQRPMVDAYPLLSFGLAAGIATTSGFAKPGRHLSAKKKTTWIPWAALVVFGALNLFQTWQSRQGVIWSEQHNGAFYYETFATLKSTKNSLRAFDTRSLQPEDDALGPDSLLYVENFEATKSYEADIKNAQNFGGSRALYTRNSYYELLNNFPLTGLHSGDWLKLSILGYLRPEEQIYERAKCLGIIIELYDESGKKRRGRRLAVSPHIGNDDFSIWHTGRPGEWGEASYYVKLPRAINDGWTAKVYLSNNDGQRLFLDDFALSWVRSL